MIYPWQEQQWQYLMQAETAKRLPHALLFSGEAGLGKLEFAHAFLRYLLCERSICQTKSLCHACRLINQEAHPHILSIAPEKKGQAIKIDQIRMINDFAYQSGFQESYRIIIIHPADSMNINAANALLKTLEEPPLGCLFILVSHQAALLPVTIRSRCQYIFFSPPDTANALTWLEPQLKKNKNINTNIFSSALLLNIAKGAPLAALNLSTDFLNNRKTLFDALYTLRKNQEFSLLPIALPLAEVDILVILDMIYSWLMDMIKVQLNIFTLTNQDYQQKISELILNISTDRIIELIIYLQSVRKEIHQGIHLNKQLLLENILIRYSNLEGNYAAS